MMYVVLIGHCFINAQVVQVKSECSRLAANIRLYMGNYSGRDISHKLH